MVAHLRLTDFVKLGIHYQNVCRLLRDVNRYISDRVGSYSGERAQAISQHPRQSEVDLAGQTFVALFWGRTRTVKYDVRNFGGGELLFLPRLCRFD